MIPTGNSLIQVHFGIVTEKKYGIQTFSLQNYTLPLKFSTKEY